MNDMKQKDDTMRATPETDDAQFGTGRVSVDFARRLERERDKARELALYSIQCLSGIISDLPSSRDWLNPDLEKLSLAVIEKAKEVLGEA